MSDTEVFYNPILRVADPFVFRHNGQYYMTGTSTGRSLQLWHHPRLEQVGQTDPLTIWEPGPGEPAYQAWSPTVFQLAYQGKLHWFIYFTAAMENTNEHHRIYVLQSFGEDPRGPYMFKGQLGGTDETTAIDASIFRLADRLYILYVLEKGTNAVYIAPMSDPLTQSGEAHLLIEPDQPWERGGDAGQSTYPVAEGPTPLYHDGRVFIVYSGTDTGNYNYCLGLLIYDGGDPLQQASWTKIGPVFEYSEEHGVYGPGRAVFTQSPDGKEHWIVYHAKETREFTYAERFTRAQPFTWRADGMPEFGVPVSLQMAVRCP